MVVFDIGAGDEFDLIWTQPLFNISLIVKSSSSSKSISIPPLSRKLNSFLISFFRLFLKFFKLSSKEQFFVQTFLSFIIIFTPAPESLLFSALLNINILSFITSSKVKSFSSSYSIGPSPFSKNCEFPILDFNFSLIESNFSSNTNFFVHIIFLSNSIFIATFWLLIKSN